MGDMFAECPHSLINATKQSTLLEVLHYQLIKWKSLSRKIKA
jgi:hypothetical protein